ncbi:MAG: 50S ribosomal protein L10 [Solirubrobacteraceae bacterium]|jgi:large subunit ribosomal protein L10
MNRDQKAAAIAEIATNIDESDAVFAVDYRGITVAQVAELRATLRQSDATFKVVKNSLTERAADQVGAEALKDFLSGPTALTFVRGDVATAAKAVADYARTTQLLPFKGGLMDGATLDVDQIRTLSRLPSREVLYGQLVGVVASPIGGLVRSLNALISGLAVALGQVNAKKESGEIPAGAAPSAAEPEAAAAEEPAADAEPAAEAAPAAEEEDVPDEVARAEDTAEAPPEDKTEPEQQPSVTEDRQDEPAQADDNQADVSAESQPEDAETTKED